MFLDTAECFGSDVTLPLPNSTLLQPLCTAAVVVCYTGAKQEIRCSHEPVAACEPERADRSLPGFCGRVIL